MAYQISRIMLKVFAPKETRPKAEDIDSRLVRPFIKKFFRFDTGGCLYTFIQDMGTPWPTLELAEKKISELEKSFRHLLIIEDRSTLRFPFEIRKVAETETMRQSWIRKGLLPPEQPVKQDSLINNLGPNENRFITTTVRTSDGKLVQRDGIEQVESTEIDMQERVKKALQDRKESGVENEIQWDH
jgi:hypothetical protein